MNRTFAPEDAPTAEDPFNVGRDGYKQPKELEEEADADADASGTEEVTEEKLADEEEEEQPEPDIKIRKRNLDIKSLPYQHINMNLKSRVLKDNKKSEGAGMEDTEEAVVSEVEDTPDPDTGTDNDTGTDTDTGDEVPDADEADTGTKEVAEAAVVDPSSFCFPLSARIPKNKVYHVVESCYVTPKSTVCK